MTDNIRKKLEFLRKGEYKNLRRMPDETEILFPDSLDEIDVNTRLLQYMTTAETPILFENDRFGFNRSIAKIPAGIYRNCRFEGSVGNITIHYDYVLGVGMDAILAKIREKQADCKDPEKYKLYEAMSQSILCCLELADRYRNAAKENNATELYRALCVVPHQGATSFYEACVFCKFLHFTLRLNRNAHLPLGGFDKYMLPYFQSDLEKGMKESELFETLEEFFITLNLDSDTYYGVQQGDNGMSMVLGGRASDGSDMYNRLSELCLLASEELCLIDPKINLRVDKNTPIERFERATELTKKGLGFPQYCNDDVVIPGLIRLGYDPEDAHAYTVAACWEFIVPNRSFDIVNIDKVNFPKTIEKATNETLTKCNNFDEFLSKAKAYVEEECRNVAVACKDRRQMKSPYLSVFVDDCIEKGLDLAEGGAHYNNYGVHGVGISTAADALAAIKKAVFDEKKCSAEELVSALEADFDGRNELRNYLLSCPKVGNDDDNADCYVGILTEIFASVFAEYRNLFGGVLRPGTGSAMEYLWSASIVGATADGRHAGTPFGSSFSPSPCARLNGPLSCIKSFTKHDLTGVINGGPLTMELHDNTFRNEDGVKKVAALVRTFILRGGHQLQLNSVNREVLLDAQKHPENHKNLIVRVWGWSGYFNELDLDYQNHIISRTEFSV